MSDVGSKALHPAPPRQRDRSRGSVKYSCLINRLSIAAVLGYVGARRVDNAVLSWIVAVAPMVATYLWATW